MRLSLAFGSFALGIVACSTTSDLAWDLPTDGGDGADARGASGGAPGGGGMATGTGGQAAGGISPAGGAGGTSAGGAAGAGGAGGAGGPDASLDGGASLDASVDASAEAAPDARAPGHFEWQLFYDRSYAAHVEVDSKGAAIVSGTFFDVKDITLGAVTLKSHGAADVMLSRVLPGGTVDWARGYGGVAEDYPVSFALDAQDRIALVGLYNGTGNIGGVDFPAFAGAAGRYDVYVASLTPSGDTRWSRTFNTTDESFGGPGIALNASGSVLVPGYFGGTANDTGGGVPQASAGSWDGYLARYDEPSGAYAGAVTFGAAGDDRGVAALFTGTDVVFIGQFHGAVTFPTQPTPTLLTSNGGADVFVARASSKGILSSVVSFGGSGDETVATARLDASGNVVLAGVFDSPSLSVLGGSALSTAGGKDMYVAKLAPDLSHVWSERFGGVADDFVRDVAVGPGGVIAITGEFRNRLIVGSDVWDASSVSDAGPTAIDIFVAKLAPGGAPVWSFAAGGPLPDRGLGVAIDAQGAVYATASFQSPVDFGGGKVLTPDAGQWGSALVRYAP